MIWRVLSKATLMIFYCNKVLFVLHDYIFIKIHYWFTISKRNGANLSFTFSIFNHFKILLLGSESVVIVYIISFRRPLPQLSLFLFFLDVPVWFRLLYPTLDFAPPNQIIHHYIDQSVLFFIHNNLSYFAPYYSLKVFVLKCRCAPKKAICLTC